MAEPVTIHIELLDEGAQAWRPVQAEPVGFGLYLVLGPLPEEEEWAFPPGSLVQCVTREFSGDGGRAETCLVAIASVETKDIAH